MTLHAPQLILLIWLALSLGSSLAFHGKAQEGHHNAAFAFFDVIMLIALLYWGGFFTNH